ncbi:ATP-binding cassette domain-containing protein [Saccharopolyspora phatthalungensis]|uniref:Ribose transport system ATP-binding protein n=1 Tax=Saccharopolyspora phatthalungensis TaxID=664693 RepID=A0A840QER8_9PSEU|nr:ATP-binding cassette domain-containing protein [Saccharopolyspora phatthalungensis]MBB5157188.1 ribose transport system ATP-binding protein [Saccharopolyspora phatthalungensis]
MEQLLVLNDVTKRFSGVVALHSASLEVLAGEVHAVVGENGAGKSTMMAIASGALAPDAGTVQICGTPLPRADPRAAQALGLAVVHQHPALLPDLTVEENLYFGVPPHQRPRGLRSRRRWSRQVLAVAADHVDPAARIASLSVADRHLVEISKALATDPRVLLLDEPTEPLNAAQCETLFDLIADIAARGVAVVYISHRIPDVLRVADRLTVLRDGRIRGTHAADSLSEQDVVTLIVGRELESTFPPKADAEDLRAETTVAVDVKDLSGPGFGPVNFTLRRGEILGLAGVQGNGQQGCLRALAGLERSRGEVRLNGERVDVTTPKRAAESGFRYVPEDRHSEGVVLDMTARENAAISALRFFSRGGLLRRRDERDAVSLQFGALQVKSPSIETRVGDLSGGNQQKVVLARCLLAKPAVLLTNEPTQGVDAGARVEIYEALRGAASSGVGVALVSSDGVELEGLCDRVLVFSRGTVVRELAGDEVTERAITSAAVTATAVRDEAKEETVTPRWRRWLSGDQFPAAILVAVALLLALGMGVMSARYFSSFNVQSILLLAAALGLAGVGQLMAIVIGGIDLSIGPMMGLGLVTASLLIPSGASSSQTVVGVLVVLGLGVLVGLVNALLIAFANITPVVATLATYIALQGVSLTLRPSPDGAVDTAFIDGVQQNLGAVPVAFVVLVVVALGLEALLRWHRWGIGLRAVGSGTSIAQRVGARVRLLTVSAYAGCSLLAAAASLLLTAQIGIGDATAGVGYTLTGITAVVLAGASITGGRGAFLPVVIAAVLLVQMINAIPFLGLDQSWQYYVSGIVVVVAAAVYSLLRRRAAGPSSRP